MTSAFEYSVEWPNLCVTSPSCKRPPFFYSPLFKLPPHNLAHRQVRLSIMLVRWMSRYVHTLCRHVSVYSGRIESVSKRHVRQATLSASGAHLALGQWENAQNVAFVFYCCLALSWYGRNRLYCKLVLMTYTSSRRVRYVNHVNHYLAISSWFNSMTLLHSCRLYTRSLAPVATIVRLLKKLM